MADKAARLAAQVDEPVRFQQEAYDALRAADLDVVKGSPTREVHVEHVRVPVDRLIGEPGDGMRRAMRTRDIHAGMAAVAHTRRCCCE